MRQLRLFDLAPIALTPDGAKYLLHALVMEPDPPIELCRLLAEYSGAGPGEVERWLRSKRSRHSPRTVDWLGRRREVCAERWPVLGAERMTLAMVERLEGLVRGRG